MTSHRGTPEVVRITASSLVAMPGAGSDGDYARRALRPLADALGVALVAVDAGSEGIVASYLTALDEAARRGPVIAAGISIGACVAVHWAAARPDSCAAVIAACPPWAPGGAGSSPAAAAAHATVTEIERSGLGGAIARMRESSPDWLADELGRSWTTLGDLLSPHLREASAATLPHADDLRRLRVSRPVMPRVVVAVADDPVHPADVADAWAADLGVVAHVIPFDDWADDAGDIGRAAASALGVTTPTGAERTRL